MRAFLLMALLLLLPLTAQADAVSFDYSSFALIPVQHEGRLKPLDSFARDFLTMFSGRSSLDGFSATAWLAEMLFDPDGAYGRNVFNVPNPAVQAAIDLPPRGNHRYSFAEISKAIAARKAMIDT